MRAGLCRLVPSTMQHEILRRSGLRWGLRMGFRNVDNGSRGRNPESPSLRQRDHPTRSCAGRRIGGRVGLRMGLISADCQVQWWSAGADHRWDCPPALLAAEREPLGILQGVGVDQVLRSPRCSLVLCEAGPTDER